MAKKEKETKNQRRYLVHEVGAGKQIVTNGICERRYARTAKTR